MNNPMNKKAPLTAMCPRFNVISSRIDKTPPNMSAYAASNQNLSGYLTIGQKGSYHE